MTEMTPLFTLFAVIPILLSGIIIYAHNRTYGTLDVTTSSVAYNRFEYDQALDWDKYALQIQGVPTMIFSAEFHYWRVPDRDRWATILKEYRSMGMNTIRIYFHWGYHSPDEGIYNFDGNKDIEYLLNLCEELGLYVLAAPGPYICAETQAGGYPGWLIAKRELRIRHSQYMLWRTYDPEFARYEVQWFEHVLPIIAKHQITENKRGCVLALQIDNELFERLAIILPIGLRDQMRVLAKAARDLGITVPLFTNDGFEESSWIPRPELDYISSNSRFWSSSPPFGLDLYGFDKYIIFAPTSAPTSWLFDTGNTTWKEWNPKNLERSLGRLERTVRAFGGGAKDSPLFIPELQGGWFNHYQLQHTYDKIYDFYGDYYTKIVLESVLAQGVTMANLYMTYGGTNWGTIGDPDVYTSYDYSACIREYGYLSMRGRNVRDTITFARSFDPYFTATEKMTKRTVKSSVRHTINTQRVARNADQAVEFTFFRNFDRKKRDLFDVSVESSSGNFSMQCFLPYKTSFIGVGNYRTVNDLRLLQSTIPIHLRMVDKDSKTEIWVVEPNMIGGLAFEHKTMQLSGNMQDDVLRRDGRVDLLKFEKSEGWTRLSSSTGDLYIIGLSRTSVSTLFADFEEGYWNNGEKRYPAFAAWGASSMFYNERTKSLEVKYRRSDRQLHVLSFNRPADPRLVPATTGVHDIGFVYAMDFGHAHQQFPLPVQINLRNWQVRSAEWSSFLWRPLKPGHDGKSLTFDALDYHFLSGHVLYRTTFSTPNKTVKLSLNMRNRATILVNGYVVGGHTTYSRQLFSPGAKIGPDPWFLGTHTYDLTPYLQREGDMLNEVIVLVDSFGLARQAFIMNDVRNPRGIIKVTVSGLDQQPLWQIAGVDVRDLSDPYNSTGFPDEQQQNGWNTLGDTTQDGTVYRFPLTKRHGVQWMQFTFDDFRQSASDSLTVPLRLHLNGPFTAQVFINDVFIARYYGNGDSPQHDFYIPDGLVHKHNSVRMLVYTWEDTTAEILIAGWPVDLRSGNLVEDSRQYVASMGNNNIEESQEFMVWKEEIRI